MHWHNDLIQEDYAIYYKGKVFDTYKTEEEAKDALDGMKLSDSEKSQYRIRQTSSKPKKFSMKENIDLDMSVDVTALVEGEDLSEEFKAKAQVIFESAVSAKVKEITKEIIAEADAKVKVVTKEVIETTNRELEESVDFIVDQVNKYLDEVVEEWLTENTLAIDSGLRTEITEEFISGLKNLFQEHYVSIPEEKTDLVQELADQVEALKTQIDQITEENKGLEERQKGFKKKEIIESQCSDLSMSQQEKLKSLMEDVEFEDEEEFTKKIEILKKSYFKSGTSTLNENTDTLGENVDTSIDEQKVTTKMDAYVKALGSTAFTGNRLFGSNKRF